MDENDVSKGVVGPKRAFDVTNQSNLDLNDIFNPFKAFDSCRTS